MKIRSVAVLAASTLLAAAAAAAPAQESPAERRAATDALVAKWGPQVQRIYGMEPDVWAQAMAPALADASLAQLRAAGKTNRFEEMNNLLLGVDNPLVADVAAVGRPLAEEAARADAVEVKAFGNLNQDLVYTPVAPCRIVDTRTTGAGMIAGGSSRSFVAINASNFTGQGGSATNCGTLGLNATAVVLAVTPVGTSSANAFLTVYPYGTGQPLAASVTYGTGRLVTNTVVAQIPNPLASFDMTVYASGSTHVVADIVGYFAPPLATAVQCVDTANAVASVSAGGQQNVVAPGCPTGYMQTATNCESQTWDMPIVYIKGGVCSAQNNSASAAELRASRTCCRVPGR